MNLYGFVGNDGVNQWDYLGFCDCGRLEMKGQKAQFGGVNTPWFDLSDKAIKEVGAHNYYQLRVMDATCKYLSISIKVDVQADDRDFLDDYVHAYQPELGGFGGKNLNTMNGRIFGFNGSAYARENPLAISKYYDYEMMDRQALKMGIMRDARKQLEVAITVTGRFTNSRDQAYGVCCEKIYRLRGKRTTKTKTKLAKGKVHYVPRVDVPYRWEK